MTGAVLDGARDYVHRVLSELTPDDLARATPCAGWDVARVLLHLADSADAVSALVETGELALPEAPRVDAPDPVAVVRERLAALDAALAAATDTARVASAALPATVELTAHGWDVGVAVDPAHRVPAALARDVLALVTPVLVGDARGDVFAAPLAVADGAVASDRLVAFLGRTPPA